MTLQFAAKILKGHGVETGPRIIFRQCREVKLMTRNKPTAASVIHGWMRQEYEHFRRNGYEADYYRPLLTWEGLAELERRLLTKKHDGPAGAGKGGGFAARRLAPTLKIEVREVDLGNGDGRLGF